MIDRAHPTLPVTHQCRILNVSRATVYRTLQWMVDAGIARKVDFGEGRFRFEHSYRQPRHFHLICQTCHRSFEFLSSDVELLIEEVATARSFSAARRSGWLGSTRSSVIPSAGAVFGRLSGFAGGTSSLRAV